MSEQTPAPTHQVPSASTTGPAAQAPAPQQSAEKQPPWGKPENFDPDKAWELIQNLRTEKGGDTEALRAQLAEIQSAQNAQKKALAEALGLTEPPKTEDALAETVRNLQEQFVASQREATILRIAAEKKIPAEYHDLLTETDPEKLAAQAEKVSALVTAKSAVEGTPAFQANPGQGQGGTPNTPEAIAEAEYRQYHPLPSRK